ncbi:MAG: GntR family transcriptional regulator [Erysipelotrichaceae bacterium]|nr:GntR family transcriptional regulator [Erysipelotrichaceae bacterium]
MSWNIDNNNPIFIQLMNIIEDKIVKGEYNSGDKIPSVRELALAAKVNPNTMQKALSELEKTGLLKSERTSGRFITNDLKLIEDHRNELALNLTHDYLNKLHEWGFKLKDIIDLINKENKDGNI